MINILEFLKFNKKSAKTAKERLQIVVSHQRLKSNTNNEEFINNLKKELMAVISKYTNINQEHINVQLQKDNDYSVLELNVTLPNSD